MAAKTATVLKNGNIKCPHCGWEYLPAEIFAPGELLGDPDSIIKDAVGKILYVDYKEDGEPVFTEQFECENCEKLFVIEAKLTFVSKAEDEELDFSNTNVSLLDD